MLLLIVFEERLDTQKIDGQWFESPRWKLLYLLHV